MLDMVFSNNVALFEKKNPRGAALLSLVDPVRYVLVDEENVPNIFDQGTKKYLHDPKAPKKEAEAWIINNHIADIELLCIYGVERGYLYRALEPWLFQQADRFVVFLEDDLELLWHFLHTEDAYSLLTSGRGELFYLEESKEGVDLLKTVGWASLGKKNAFLASPFYGKEKRDSFQEIEKRFFYERAEIEAVSEEYLQWGIPYFRNFWQNMALFDEIYNGQKLFSSFRKIPAIITAAGPSLDEEKDLLKQLQDKALLFAGGSSINALAHHGIRPDFLIGIDPNLTQYFRFRDSLAYDIPCFFRTRFHPEALKMVSGKKLYLRGGDGYQLSDWIERKLGIYGPMIGGGHNVANFAIEIAYMLGCDPIILVGFDLSYGNDLSLYATGVTTEEELEATPIIWKNDLGEEVCTEYKWIAESGWITDFQAKHPKRKLFNATKGGLGIQGVPRMSLEEIERRFLKNSFDIQGYVQTIVGSLLPLKNPQETIHKHTVKLRKSISKAKKYIENIFEYIETVSSVEALQEDFQYLNLEGQVQKESAYTYMCEVFDRMYVKRTFSTEYIYGTQDLSFLRYKSKQAIKDRYGFIYNVLCVNQILVDTMLGENT